MTIDVSKLNIGVVAGPAGGVVVSKVNIGVVTGPNGLIVAKINYGVVVDTLAVAGRRRQMFQT